MDAAHNRSSSRPLIPAWAARPMLALTGLLMVAFVAVHMLGNLKILIAPEQMDAYAAWLRELLVPLLPREGALWAFRIVLLAAVLTHIVCALSLRGPARRTRTRGARIRTPRGLLARMMGPTGILIGLLLVLHLLDLTLGVLVAPDSFQGPDPAFHAAANVLASLARPAAAAAYALFLLALALHLLHGIPLAVKDLGAAGGRALKAAEVVGALIVLAILLGDGAIILQALVKGLAP